MFRKLSNSLTSPKEVAKYYNESFGKTILFILILLVFVMVPTVISLLTSDMLSENTKKIVKNSFVNAEVAFEIEDGVLHNINGDTDYVYTNETAKNMHIVFTENIEKAKAPIDGYAIVLTKDGIYQIISLLEDFPTKIASYSDYEYLKNLDFSDPEIFSDINFWDNVFNVTSMILNEARPMYIISNLLYYVVYWIGMIVLFVFIMTFFAKMRTGNYLGFWKIFKLTFYSLTPFIVCLVFSTLFNLGFLVYIGYLISAIYSFITINEVLKRLYLSRNEGE